MAFALLISTNCSGQMSSTSTVMYYNLLNFPNTTCSPNREDTLRVILQEILPDIFMVSEMNDSSGVNRILQFSLNVNGISSYRAANYVPNGSGTNNLQNMLFYNSDKFTLVEQNEINTGLRDINHYRVYANDSALASHQDTLFLNLYVGHLKAGPSQASMAERKRQVDSLRAWTKGFPVSEAHLLGADLNVYECAEPAYQCLVNSFPCDFEDPIYSCGNWHDNSAYQAIHTQSTRCTALCTGASGGIDDRFDQILVSANIINGISRFQTDSATYAAYGNPAPLIDTCLGSPWSHPTLPPNVVSALYHMSDHFPVVLDLDISFPAVLVDKEDADAPVWVLSLQNPVQDQLRVFLNDEKPGSLDWEILSAWGAVVSSGKWDSNSGENRWNIPVQVLASGTYFLRVQDLQNYQTTVKPFLIGR